MRYTASKRRVQVVARARRGSGSRWEDPPQAESAEEKARHPLDANFAERSWGAPDGARRCTELVGATTSRTVAAGDDDGIASTEPVPPAKRGLATARPDFGWNSCRFIATRFQ
jgi:hypothetical protein